MINALDRDDKSADLALWAKLPDSEDWRLLIASDLLDQTSPLSGYEEVNCAMKKAGIRYRTGPSILLRSMNNPMILALCNLFATA